MEIEGEEKANGCSQGLIVMDDVDVGSDFRGEPSAVIESSDIVVLEEADVPLPAHAYSKIGKIPL